MMNTLDATQFEPLMADDFHYTSQKVFHEIESKQEYLTYIRAKFKALKETESEVWAELGKIKESSLLLGAGGPCVVLAQGSIEDIVAVVVAEVEGDKIARMDMCLPGLFSGERSGEYPR